MLGWRLRVIDEDKIAVLITIAHETPRLKAGDVTKGAPLIISVYNRKQSAIKMCVTPRQYLFEAYALAIQRHGRQQLYQQLHLYQQPQFYQQPQLYQQQLDQQPQHRLLLDDEEAQLDVRPLNFHWTGSGGGGAGQPSPPVPGSPRRREGRRLLTLLILILLILLLIMRPLSILLLSLLLITLLWWW